MSRQIVFNWPSANNAAVSALQTFAGAGTLAINGTLSAPQFPGSNINVATFYGIQRVVSLTSTNNLSAVNFTISGFLNGLFVSETRVGPNNNTVSTGQLFNIVTSITFDAAVTAVSAGSGFTGATNLYQFDYHTTAANLGIQVVVNNGSGAITYSTELTMDDANKVTPNFFTPIAAMTAATTSQIANTTQPMLFTRIKVTASSGTASLVATFAQQSLI